MRHSCIQATEDTYVHLRFVVIVACVLAFFALENQPWPRKVYTAHSEWAVGNDGTRSQVTESLCYRLVTLLPARYARPLDSSEDLF